jgi:hypothetical protein
MTQIRIGRPEPRLGPRGSIRLTGRGAVVALFGGCLLGLLLAAWTGWSALADAVFVMGCGVVTYHTRASGLRYVVVCPPLAFFAACLCVQVLTSSGTFGMLEGVLVTLGLAAPWLFTGTALTIAIAFGRGLRWTRRGGVSGPRGAARAGARTSPAPAPPRLPPRR